MDADMLSRGKRLVSLSLSKVSNTKQTRGNVNKDNSDLMCQDKDTEINATTNASVIKDQLEPIVDNQTAIHNNTARNTIDYNNNQKKNNVIHVRIQGSVIECKNGQDLDLESDREKLLDDTSDQDTHLDDILESYYDYDDDVRDPDWAPPKKKRKRFTLPISSFPLETDEDTDISNSDKEEVSQETNKPTKVNSVEINTEADGHVEYMLRGNELLSPGPSDVNSIEASMPDIGHEESLQRNEEVSNPEHVTHSAKKVENKKDTNKRLRMQGLNYLGVKKNESGKKTHCAARNERIIGERECSKRCDKLKDGRKCKTISDETRHVLFNSFWRDLDWEQKKMYVISLVEYVDVKRRTSNEKESKRRNFTFKYYLKSSSEERVPVCKGMFLSTLGLHEKMVYKWVVGVKLGIPKSVDLNTEKPASDANENAKIYLLELPKIPSHYCRAKTNKQYLEPVFTSLAELHQEYRRKMISESKPHLGRTQFSKLFYSMNLSLFQPKKDQCDLCCAFEAKTVNEDEYNKHIKRKDEARAQKQTDKEISKEDSSVKMYTIDLQSLLVCPKLQASCMYYKMKLSCHNYTIYDMVTRNVMCYFWTEVDGDLQANSFASCLIDFLENENLEGVKHIIIYSDGCSYQNRNVVLSNALLRFAINSGITVEQKYLERGHTQMEVDSVHGTIERQIKKSTIYLPQDYVDKIKLARRAFPYQVKYVDYTFFTDFSKLGMYNSIRPGLVTGDAVVTDIRLLRYTTNGTILYKLNFSDEDFSEVPKPRSNRASDTSSNSLTVSKLFKKQLPLKKTKFQHLQQLKQVIPKDYHAFYDNLPHISN